MSYVISYENVCIVVHTYSKVGSMLKIKCWRIQRHLFVNVLLLVNIVQCLVSCILVVMCNYPVKLFSRNKAVLFNHP